MSLALVLCLLIIAIFFIIQLLSIFWMIREDKDKPDSEFGHDLPLASLLLAARNEEELIIRSLESIAAQSYPEGKLEVWIGNDASTDRTRELIQNYVKDKPMFHLLDITETLGKGRGKANVLAQLAHKAEGELFLITDVDVRLPEDWAKEMVLAFEPGVALVSGTTMCERGGLFANMQSVDWLHFMGYIKAFAKVGISCTSVGNNMAVRAEAYWQTGGYENIDFSITEDYKLFKELTERGWGWRNVLSSGTLGKAWYIPSVKEMLHQRKRWLIGAQELPLNWKLLIVLYGLFLPAIGVLFYIQPELAWKVWFVKFNLQTLFILILCAKAGEKPFKIFTLLLYEFYVILNTLASALFYILPVRSVWKGRVYNKEYIRD